MVGYFAFPPSMSGAALDKAVRPQPLPPPTTDPHLHASEPRQNASEAAQQAERIKQQRQRAEDIRRARLERENQQIYLSELDWVRSGGILRDANGRRDKVRTEEFRKEIRLQNEEREIMRRWDAYESSLRALQHPSNSLVVGWETIPWPVISPPSEPADLNSVTVGEFIFSTFKVRGAKAIRKERLRTSILRWHPDKFSALLARVPDPEHAAILLDGVNAVFIALRGLQDEAKISA